MKPSSKRRFAVVRSRSCRRGSPVNTSSQRGSACWRNAADFRQVVYSCRSFEELARMFRCHPEEEPSIRRDLVRFLIVALVVGVVIGLLARYT